MKLDKLLVIEIREGEYYSGNFHHEDKNKRRGIHFVLPDNVDLSSPTFYETHIEPALKRFQEYEQSRVERKIG